jgi:multidrug efflux pump subunit AcrB
VLAIGIVVDNAIVVVEAVHAKMHGKEQITPYAATKLVLHEIAGAVIAITLVMTAVFVPVTFMTGPVGVSSTGSSPSPWQCPSCSPASWRSRSRPCCAP